MNSCHDSFEQMEEDLAVGTEEEVVVVMVAVDMEVMVAMGVMGVEDGVDIIIIRVEEVVMVSIFGG